MNQIFSFAWKVMFGSWAAFLFLDVLRPGFVSEIFSAHWFLLAALVCGGISLANSSPPAGRKGGVVLVGFLSGAILSILVWRAGEAFGDLRIFLSLFVFVLPWGLMRALRD